MSVTAYGGVELNTLFQHELWHLPAPHPLVFHVKLDCPRGLRGAGESGVPGTAGPRTFPSPLPARHLPRPGESRESIWGEFWHGFLNPCSEQLENNPGRGGGVYITV